MTRTVRTWAVLASSVAAGCGGGSAGPSALLQVGGEYDIRKTVLEDTCDPTRVGTVLANPGTVRHTPGAAAFVLNDHGTRDLPGTVRSDGTFTLDPYRSTVMQTIPAVDTFSEGRFTAPGFHLSDTTDLSAASGSAACRQVTGWEGAKRGTPNVIP